MPHFSVSSFAHVHDGNSAILSARLYDDLHGKCILFCVGKRYELKCLGLAGNIRRKQCEHFDAEKLNRLRRESGALRKRITE